MILGLGGVSIATVIDLEVYAICPPLLRQPRRTSSFSGTSRFRKGHATGTSFNRFRRSEPARRGERSRGRRPWRPPLRSF